DGVPFAQGADAGVIQRAAMTSTTPLGDHTEIPGVAVGMEACRPVSDLEPADEPSILLGDQPRLEETRAVECVVLVPHLLHRPRVVRVAAIRRGDPCLVVGG